MTEPLASRGKVTDDDEIDLREIWQVLVKYKLMILTSTFLAAMLAAAYSLTMPNIYRAEVLLAPVNGDSGKGGAMASALGGLGGLASLAGISLPGRGSTEENIAVLKSREFIWKFVQENNLMPILFQEQWDAKLNKWKDADAKKQPGQMDAFRQFSGVLNVVADKKTGLLTVSIDWTDPESANQWANKLLDQLNHYLRAQAITRSQYNLKYLNEELARTQVEEMRKTLFDLIGQEQKNAMLANAQREFAFRVLDPAVTPDTKVAPKRSRIVLLTALFVALISVVVAFVWDLKGVKTKLD